MRVTYEAAGNVGCKECNRRVDCVQPSDQPHRAVSRHFAPLRGFCLGSLAPVGVPQP